MKHYLLLLPLLVLCLLTSVQGIEYFMHGSQFTWQAQARLWLANGRIVEGNFTVSDPWLTVLPSTQSHTIPLFWNEILSIEMKSGNEFLIKKSDGSTIKSNFIYGITSGDRIYFYATEVGSITRDIYVLVLNERKKPTPEFIHVHKIEFLATPVVDDPVVFSTYR